MTTEIMNTADAPADRRRYIASGTGGKRTSDLLTPRAAALAFFEAYPTARKCDVREWHLDERGMLVMVFTIGGPADKMPRNWDGVTAKTAATLPAA